MNYFVWFKFYTSGWGGHELMAVNNIKALLNINTGIYISCTDPFVKNKLIEENPCLADFIVEINSVELDNKNTTEVVVTNSILRLTRHIIDGSLGWHKIFKSYYYAPFWGFEWNDGFLRLFKKYICKFIGLILKIRIIGISPFFFERVGLNCGIVWPNTISRKYCTIRGSETDSLTLINIGRLDFKHKQQDKLIDWFTNFAPRLRCPIEKLIIIGSGKDESKIKNKIFYSKNILLLEWSNEIIIPEKSILVICSKFEGLPLVALEAMASNIPIIYHRECGLDKLLDSCCAFDIINSESVELALNYVNKNWDQIIRSNFSTYSKLHSTDANHKAIINWIQKL